MSQKCHERPFAGGDGIAVRGHGDLIAEGHPTMSRTRNRLDGIGQLQEVPQVDHGRP